MSYLYVFPLSRYRIEVIADDGYQTGSFVIFNDAGLKLCKTSASELAVKKVIEGIKGSLHILILAEFV